MGRRTNQALSVTVSTVATLLAAKFPEIATSVTVAAALAQLGVALDAGPYLEQTRLKQAKCFSDAAEQISQAKEGESLELTPRQLEVCTDIVRTVGETIDEDKLAYLKNCLVNTALAKTDDTAGGRYALARIIRDITAHEIRFLVDNRHKTTIKDVPIPQTVTPVVTEPFVKIDDADVVYVDSSQDPGLIAALTAFGLIIPTGGWEVGSYFTPLRDALCNLVMPADSH